MMYEAIQTRYAGCFFRSRLEARWAVFFTALGLKWEYEPEGYHLPSGNYLPDFFVEIQKGSSRAVPGWTTPTPGYWVAIKGAPPDVLELRKISELTYGTNHRSILIWGMPDSREWWETNYNNPEPVRRGPNRKAYEFFLNCVHRPPGNEDEGLWRVYLASLYLFALKSARSARFEHGESGAPR